MYFRDIPRFLLMSMALAPFPASAQASYNFGRQISASQVALPSRGPAAARINPAELAGVRLAALAYGHSGSSSGKGKYDFFQAAAGLSDFLEAPVGIAVGFGSMREGGDIDGSPASFEEAEYVPGIAIRFPADSATAWHVDAGLACTLGEYNAFNAVRSYSAGISAGTAVSFAGKAGRFGAGLAYHDLKSPRMRLPDDSRGEYVIPGWREYSLDWTSVHRPHLFQQYVEPGAGPLPSEGMDLPGNRRRTQRRAFRAGRHGPPRAAPANPVDR